MHTAEKEVYNVECVFLFQVHLRRKYDIMSFVCNKLSVLHEGHSRCGKVSKWNDDKFLKEVSPKQAINACLGLTFWGIESRYTFRNNLQVKSLVQ